MDGYYFYKQKRWQVGVSLSLLGVTRHSWDTRIQIDADQLIRVAIGTRAARITSQTTDKKPYDCDKSRQTNGSNDQQLQIIGHGRSA